MLYISNGYDAERGRALASLFGRAARQANLIVVAVNAAGIPGSVPMHDSRVEPEVWKEIVAARRESLRAIAEPTGGFALLDDVDVIDGGRASARRFPRSGNAPRVTTLVSSHLASW